jgi:ubiquinone/menaquinone biosynthesis C-methylase UbiE
MALTAGIFEDPSHPSTWAERAPLGELSAVISPFANERRNRFLHLLHMWAARSVLSLSPPPGTLLDFGCGTGRFVRFFASRGYRVIATEVTPEMLREARRYGVPSRAVLVQNDGVHLPIPDESVDVIWICGVLRLVAEQPVYRQIVAEMYRVLKPGRAVVNAEMCTTRETPVFTHGFESSGFVTRRVQMLHRYGRWDRIFQSPRMPLTAATVAAYALLRSRLDSPRRRVRGTGARDYLMVWEKPGTGAGLKGGDR